MRSSVEERILALAERRGGVGAAFRPGCGGRCGSRSEHFLMVAEEEEEGGHAALVIKEGGQKAPRCFVEGRVG